jgi:dCMP deaminase
MKKSWDRFFLDFAELTAQQSYDIKTRVGTVIVKDDHILSYSYNGTPPGWDNSMRDDNGKTLPSVIHAEAYALAKLARSPASSDGATLYCTLSPCVECVKLILAAGISRVVYRDTYKSQDGVDMLVKAEVETVQYKSDGVYPKYKCSGKSHTNFVGRTWVEQHTGLAH